MTLSASWQVDLALKMVRYYCLCSCWLVVFYAFDLLMLGKQFHGEIDIDNDDSALLLDRWLQNSFFQLVGCRVATIEELLNATHAMNVTLGGGCIRLNWLFSPFS